MKTEAVLDRWMALFPRLAGAGDAAARTLRERLQVARFEAGLRLFHQGAACRNYLMVTAGDIRVQLLGSRGREVLLYHVRPGETCILTTSCLLAGKSYPAEGWTEAKVTACTLALPDFERALAESAAFRRFVFGDFGRRLSEVIARMEALALDPVRGRLAEFLVERAEGGVLRNWTHERIALELGSVREVVSRNLKQLERMGLVELGRNRVTILKEGMLKRQADV
jgi:CRP/FNR family transcriptional regulator